jgi:hypothetical protein
MSFSAPDYWNGSMSGSDTGADYAVLKAISTASFLWYFLVRSGK